MEIKDKKHINQLNDLISQIKLNIKDNINGSYAKLTKNKNLTLSHVEKWKNLILSNIYLEINKIIEYIFKNLEVNKVKEANDIKEIKIESANEFDSFTSKDIQEENKEITRTFQNEAYNYMNNNEKNENESVAYFLKEVAKISRISYIEGKKLFQSVKDKYTNLKISKSTEKENFLKEISSWVKKLEKEKNKKEYENFLNHININEAIDNKNNSKFFNKIFNDLTIMYFHCQMSFPSVEINFDKNDDFISDKMIDFINRGKKRKVNFIILPSLISNGNYLQNGKSWVFTYTKTSFKFDDNYINAYLNESFKAKPFDNINANKNKNKLNVIVSFSEKKDKKYIKISTNMDIPEKYEFHFHLLSKMNQDVCVLETKKKIFEIDNFYEILKYELFINNKIIVSSNEIFQEV